MSNAYLCVSCGTYQVAFNCPECYNRKQFSKLLQQNEQLLAKAEGRPANTKITGDDPGAGGILGLIFLVLMVWAFFKNSGSDEPVTNQPYSALYVQQPVENGIKASLAPGVEYRYYRDSSCTSGMKDTSDRYGKTISVFKDCLTNAQAKQVCLEFDGVNTVDTKIYQLHERSPSKWVKMNGVEVLDTQVTFTELTRRWTGDKCMIQMSVFDDNHPKQPSAIQWEGHVSAWKVNSAGKLVATWANP